MKILKLPEPENKELLKKLSTIPSIRLKTITPNPFFNGENNFKLYRYKLGENFRHFTDRTFPMLLLQPTDNLLTRLEEMGMLTY